MGTTRGTGARGAEPTPEGEGGQGSEGEVQVEVTEVEGSDAPRGDEVHETVVEPDGVEPDGVEPDEAPDLTGGQDGEMASFLLTDDPTPASVFTGVPPHHDPITDDGQGYDAAGNCYPEGVGAKVNKARAAIDAYREAQAEADRLRGEASMLVARALDDGQAEDVDDLRQFQSNPTP